MPTSWLHLICSLSVRVPLRHVQRQRQARPFVLMSVMHHIPLASRKELQAILLAREVVPEETRVW